MNKKLSILSFILLFISYAFSCVAMETESDTKENLQSFSNEQAELYKELKITDSFDEILFAAFVINENEIFKILPMDVKILIVKDIIDIITNILDTCQKRISSQMLCLLDEDIGLDQAKAIKHFLPKLNHLSLIFNNGGFINTEAIQKLFEVIKHNESLESVNFIGIDNFGKKEITMLATCIKGNKFMTELKFSLCKFDGNNMGVLESRALLDALNSNTTLTSFTINRYDANPKSIEINKNFEKLIKRNIKIADLLKRIGYYDSNILSRIKPKMETLSPDEKILFLEDQASELMKNMPKLM